MLLALDKIQVLNEIKCDKIEPTLIDCQGKKLSF